MRDKSMRIFNAFRNNQVVGHGYVCFTADRKPKVDKILLILSEKMGSEIKGMRILDIGTGSGGIAHYLAEYGNDVTSVDVVRQFDEKYTNFNFVLVENEKLPFANESFDIVISHMVIEHVYNQKLHLSEIHRVLKSCTGGGGGGFIYFSPQQAFSL
jgi:ubiquinone/menaquinone biosynthesis C-methylase UbiE